MSQSLSQDTDELVKQTASRVERLAPDLWWPSVAYHAKLNEYGSFFGKFYEKSTNRPVVNSEVNHSTVQSTSVSPANGHGCAAAHRGSQHQEQSKAAVDRKTTPNNDTQSPTLLTQLYLQHEANGEVAGIRGGTAAALPPQPPPQHQPQRKGPRGFNIPRPSVRGRPTVAASAPSTTPASDKEVGDPSPISPSNAHSPGKQQQELLQPSQQQQQWRCGFVQPTKQYLVGFQRQGESSGAVTPAGAADTGELQGGSTSVAHRASIHLQPARTRESSAGIGDVASVVSDLLTAGGVQSERGRPVRSMKLEPDSVVVKEMSGMMEHETSGPPTHRSQDLPRAIPIKIQGASFVEGHAFASIIATQHVTCGTTDTEIVPRDTDHHPDEAIVKEALWRAPGSALTKGLVDASSRSCELELGKRRTQSLGGPGTSGDPAPYATVPCACNCSEATVVHRLHSPSLHHREPNTIACVAGSTGAAAEGECRRNPASSARGCDPNAMHHVITAPAACARSGTLVVASCAHVSQLCEGIGAEPNGGNVEIMCMELGDGCDDAGRGVSLHTAAAVASTAAGRQSPALVAAMFPSSSAAQGTAAECIAKGSCYVRSVVVVEEENELEAGLCQGPMRPDVVVPMSDGNGAGTDLCPEARTDAAMNEVVDTGAAQESVLLCGAFGFERPSGQETAQRAWTEPQAAVVLEEAGEASRAAVGLGSTQAKEQECELGPGSRLNLDTVTMGAGDMDAGFASAAALAGQMSVPRAVSHSTTLMTAATVYAATVAVARTAAEAEGPTLAVSALVMPPPPAQLPPLTKQQSRSEWSSWTPSAGMSINRRMSSMSLQTLESGELPSTDTPAGGTPSSCQQPLPLPPHMKQGTLHGRSSSLLGSLLLLQGHGGSSGVGRGATASRKDIIVPVESGELPLTLSEMIPSLQAGLLEEGPPAGDGTKVPLTTNCAQAAELESAATDAFAARPGLELNLHPRVDSCRRRRWGKPVDATPAAEAGMEVADEGGGGAAVTATAQVSHVVDLSIAKGLVEHLSTHGFLQDKVPSIQALSSAATSDHHQAVSQTQSQLQAPFRTGPAGNCTSPAHSERSEQRSEQELDRGKEWQREREARGSKERPVGPAAGVGSATAQVDSSVGARCVVGQGGPPRPSRSRSRSRERRRFSRSPRRRCGTRSRSRSRSGAREWRGGRRHRARLYDYDRYRDHDYDRHSGRDRDRVRDRYKDRESTRERDEKDRRGGEERYDSRYDKSRDHSRVSDRARDGGRGGDTRQERGASGGSASGTARQGRELLILSSHQQQHQDQQFQQSLQHQQHRRLAATTVSGSAAVPNAGAGNGTNVLKRSAAEAAMESGSAGSVYPHKRQHRDLVVNTRAAGSNSRGGSGSDMDLDDSDDEVPAQRSRPLLAAAGAATTAPPAVTVPAALGPSRTQMLTTSESSLGAAGVPRRHGATGGGIGFGQRHHARSAAAAAAAAAVAGTMATAFVGSNTHSPMSTVGLSPGQAGGGSAASPVPAAGTLYQATHVTSAGGPRSVIATATAAPDASASGSARQPEASRRAQMLPSYQTHSQQDLSQRQSQLPQQQQQAPASLQGKAERALAKLQQDRGRPVQSPGGGGRDPPLVTAKVRAGREAGGMGGISSMGGGSGAQASCGGLAPSGLYDTDAALDLPGNARVGGDAPLSANMEPDLLGFVALSMIQFSCAYMVESPRSLFNKAHIKTLAEESRTLRRRADCNREANGNRWTTLQLTLYLQAALKNMESAYGHEQAGQERDMALRHSLDLLSSAAHMLNMVSIEAHRLAQQLPKQAPLHHQHKQLDGDGGTRATPVTPLSPPKCVVNNSYGSTRSLGGMQTTSGLATAAGSGGRTQQHDSSGGSMPLAAAAANSHIGGPVPHVELLVLEALRLLALKLMAICRLRWLLVNQDTLAQALKLHEPSPAQVTGLVGPGGDDGVGSTGAGASGRRTSPAAAADSASSTLEAAALTASTYTASIQQMVDSVQACMLAADAWRRAASEARAFNQAVSAPGVEPAAVVAAARIGALGYEGGLWDLMGSVNLARKALDSITGML